jgi:hypothetical protein
MFFWAVRLFDGCLANFGVYEHIKPDETTESYRCLTDGENFMWAFANDEGFLSGLTVYKLRMNYPFGILNAIGEAFQSHIYDEYDFQYHGFKTQEEMDRFFEETRKRDQEEFYIELMKFVRGEDNNINPGTNGEVDARIAQDLVAKDPSLGCETRKDELTAIIGRIREEEVLTPRYFSSPKTLH